MLPGLTAASCLVHCLPRPPAPFQRALPWVASAQPVQAHLSQVQDFVFVTAHFHEIHVWGGGKGLEVHLISLWCEYAM